jgi:hypothetical protein
MRGTLAAFVVLSLLMMQAPSAEAKGIELESREYGGRVHLQGRIGS